MMQAEAAPILLDIDVPEDDGTVVRAAVEEIAKRVANHVDSYLITGSTDVGLNMFVIEYNYEGRFHLHYGGVSGETQLTLTTAQHEEVFEALSAMPDVEAIIQKHMLSAEEKAWLRTFADRIVLLCLIHFATMPVAYFAAMHGGVFFVYCFLLVKFTASYLTQRRLATDFLGWYRRCDLPPSIAEALQMHLDGPTCSAADATSCMVVVSILAGGLSWSWDTVSSILEAVDPDLDSMTAGSSFHMLQPEQEALFEKSWASFPPVAYLGMPGTLTTLLVFAVLKQLEALYRKSRILIVVIERGAPLRCLFNYIAHVTDLGGLLVVNRSMNVAWRESMGHPGERCTYFQNKVVWEVLPAAWFAISYFALVFDTADWTAKANILVSIGSSFVTAGKGLVSMVPILARTWHEGLWARERWIKWYAGSWVFTVVMLAWMTARLVGVLTCPSHVWNLTSLGCVAST